MVIQNVRVGLRKSDKIFFVLTIISVSERLITTQSQLNLLFKFSNFNLINENSTLCVSFHVISIKKKLVSTLINLNFLFPTVHQTKAKKLGLPYLSAFLDSVGSNYSHGANFATAGSTIRPQNTTLHQTGGFSPFSLDVQFNQFSDFQRRTQFFHDKGNAKA